MAAYPAARWTYDGKQQHVKVLNMSIGNGFSVSVGRLAGRALDDGGVRGWGLLPMDAPGAPNVRAQEKEKKESTEKKEKKEGRHVLGAPAFQPFPTHGG